MKRYFSLLLALLLISGTVSCGKGNDGKETKETVQSTAVTDTETAADGEKSGARLDSGLGSANYDGYKFNIYVHIGTAVPTNDFDAEELNGEPINDAKYARVITVQELANCVIEDIVVTTDNAQGHTKLGNSVQAGTNDYDLASLTANSSCNALVAGFLANLNKVGNLDLSREWWDQRAVESFTFKDAVYQATGDISIYDNRATFCCYFNKNMAADYELPNMYEMVDNGTWTLDNLKALAEAVPVLDTNSDGNHINDPNDLYGIYVWDDVMIGMVNACGIQCCTLDQDGKLSLTLFSERFVDAFSKFSASLFNKDVTCAYQRNTYTGVDFGQIAFMESRALFFLKSLLAATELRDMEDDFGILPLPKYDEAQDGYCNSAASWTLTLYSIPKNAYGDEGLARAGYITQALAYESLYTLTPAYYDQTLQNKVSRDVESSRMLDLIFSTRFYDLGWYFGIGGFNEKVMNLLRNYSTDVTSMYQKAEKSASNKLTNYNEKLQEMIAADNG